MTDTPTAALPVDHDTERALIGAALVWSAAVSDATPIVTADDFAHPAHQHIWHAIVGVWQHGAVDPVLVAERIRTIQHPDCTLDYLHQLINHAPAVSLATTFAARIADLAARRRLIHTSSDVARLAADAPSAQDAIDQSRALLDRIHLPTVIGSPSFDVDQLLDLVDMSYDWLIPGFLEVGDRLLLTAGEGAGKSTLLAQMATMAAAGIHPWTLKRHPPLNVLVVDCENGDKLVMRRYSMMRHAAGTDLEQGRLRIEWRPEGIDLTSRTDRNWLLDRCLANAAQLLVIGPVYKLSSGVARRGDIGGEEAAKETTAALDEIRMRAGVALLMETHAPHGNATGRDLRPFGSSVWLRWPEFGIGLRPQTKDRILFDVEHWRGARDVRQWPEVLRRGAAGDHWRWPWQPIMKVAQL